MDTPGTERSPGGVCHTDRRGVLRRHRVTPALLFSTVCHTFL